MSTFKIESDGTVEGTTVYIDGRAVTDEEEVVFASLSVSSRYGEWIRFNYATREVNEEGATEITEYSYEKSDDEPMPTMRAVSKPIGRTNEDEAHYLTTDKLVGKRDDSVVIRRDSIDPRHTDVIAQLLEGKIYKLR